MASALDSYIEVLKELTNTRSDSDLATALGKAKQTVSSWRRRGTVPLQVQYQLADRFGPKAALYEEVREATTSRERQAIVAIWLSLFDLYRSDSDPHHDASRYVDWAQAFLNCEDELQGAIRAIGFLEDGDDQHTVAQMVLAMIRGGKLPAVTRSLDVFVRRSLTPDDV